MGRQRRAKSTKGAPPIRLAPLLVCFLAGSVLTVLGLWHWGVLGPQAPLEIPPAPGAPEAAGLSRREALERLLTPAARWSQRDLERPMVWTGTLEPAESVVQWNARISAGVESLGLEILEGREEILTRPRGRPLTRLTLVVGDAGEVLATLVVEAVRSPSLPPAF